MSSLKLNAPSLASVLKILLKLSTFTTFQVDMSPYVWVAISELLNHELTAEANSALFAKT